MVSPEEQQHAWDEQLPYALIEYRTSVYKSTGEYSSMMMLGRLPIDLTS